MLSRHAEGLFWLGRYVERASYVTRMLDVASNKQLERSAAPSRQVWRDLLRVLYLEDEFAASHGADVSTGAINRFLVFDKANPSSIVASVVEARANVMSVRDIVPIELLETVNQLYLQLTNRSLERFVDRSPHELYEAVAGQCRAVTGAIDEAMPRNDGYSFLMLGRLLERAEMTCRMIDVNRTASGHDSSAWMSVLRSVSGFHGFMQQYGPLAPADDVVRFMLQEPSFPFGVLHCLRRAAALTEEVGGAEAWTSARRVGRLTAELGYAEIPPIGDDALEVLLENLQDGIQLASEGLHADLYQLGGDPLLYSFEAV
jgi:uncharacterized alpha-E superfamily protein